MNCSAMRVPWPCLFRFLSFVYSQADIVVCQVAISTIVHVYEKEKYTERQKCRTISYPTSSSISWRSNLQAQLVQELRSTHAHWLPQRVCDRKVSLEDTLPRKQERRKLQIPRIQGKPFVHSSLDKAVCHTLNKDSLSKMLHERLCCHSAGTFVVNCYIYKRWDFINWEFIRLR